MKKAKQVRRYFIQVEKKYKEQENLLAELSPEVKAIFAVDKRITQVDSKVEAVNRDLQDFKMDLPILGIEIDRITSAVHKRGVDALGGKNSNSYKDASIRSKVYQDIHRELKRQFGVSTYKAIKRSQCDLAVSIISEYELPLVLQEQIKNCNAQMNMGVA